MSKVRGIKLTTTIMDTIGMVIAGLAAIFGLLLLLEASGFLKEIGNFFQGDHFDELVGGYEILGGVMGYGLSLVGLMFAWIILALSLGAFILFGVGAIHGIVIQKKTRSYMLEGITAYKKAAKRDSIIKLIFNGIPGILFLVDCVQSKVELELIAVLYYGIICALEIWALSEIKKI